MLIILWILLEGSLDNMSKTYVKYSKKIGDLICKRLSQGEPLSAICKSKGLPHYETVMNWVREGNQEGGKEEYKEFAYNYAHARENQAHYYADQLHTIISDQSRYYLKDINGDLVIDEHGNPKLDPFYRDRIRVESDNLKWIAARLAPKVYGKPVNVSDTTEVKEPQLSKELQEYMRDKHGLEVNVINLG